MNFYTSTYDLNNPTTTQVNVPTNTDYKIGLKFRRNGELQNLDPNSVMLGTLSADAEKTNGYVTFTTEAGDEPSFRQLDVAVNHGYEMKFYDHNEMVNTSGSTQTVTALSADMSDYAGITVKPSDMLLYCVGKNSTTPPTEAEMEENLTDYWHIPESFGPLNAKPLVVDSNGVAKIYAFTEGPTKEQYCANLGWPSDKPAFFCATSDNTLYMQETYTFEDGDILVLGKDFSLRNNRNVAAMCKITVGTPFSANFKLNINEFKSQKGDLNPAPTEFETVNYAGTDGDGEAFSYDIVIK